MDNLPEFYKQKALEELNEDENIRKQSIEQFRKWIDEHPFITRCDIDECTILSYLRGKKFVMDKVFENFNKMVILLKSNPKFLDYSNPDQLLELYDKGGVVVMKDRDAEGRRVLIYRHKIIEGCNILRERLASLCSIVNTTLIYEPETQICGMVVVSDVRDVSMRYLSSFQILSMTEIVSMFSINPLRIKKISVVGLPVVAKAIMELIKSFTTPEIRKKVSFYKNFEELSSFMDLTNLPVEYGGTADVQECLQTQRNKFIEIVQTWPGFMEKIKVDEMKMKEFEKRTFMDFFKGFPKMEAD